MTNLKNQRTYQPKHREIERDWWIVDAEGKTLGRLASQVATILKGKHKPIYAPHVDTGDYVIIVNAEKIRVTGQRLDQKLYYHHSGYPGGLSEINLRYLLKKHPTRPVKFAVRGMLPKNVLGRQMLRKLKVYAGPDHPHEGQQPKPLTIER